MKLKVQEGCVVYDDKADKTHKAGDTFERHKDQTVQAWLDSGAVEEITKEEK
jgi:hypothetical protein